VQFDNNILVEMAAYYNRGDIIKYLINSNVDVNTGDGKILNIFCSSSDDISTLNFLIDAKADIHMNNDCPLRCCIDSHHIHNAKLLLDANANVHVNNEEPLKISIRNDGIHFTKLLLEYGADIGADISHELSCVVDRVRIKRFSFY
jgi:ankyrin repeat protein